jgi:hypothetical protein
MSSIHETSTSYASVGRKVYRNFEDRALDRGLKERELLEGITVVVPVWKVHCTGIVRKASSKSWYVETRVSIIPLHFCSTRECWVCSEALKKQA